MDISIIAMNRMLENSVKEGKISKEVLKNNGKTVLSDIRKLEDEVIISRLRNIGVHIEKTAFFKSIRKYPSSEEYYIWLINEKKLKLKGMDRDILWMCLTVIWERWFPEVPNFEMIDDKMYSGYMLLEEEKCIEACNLWWNVWNDIIYIMDHHGIFGINEFDRKFRGTQSVFNWASDFDMELYNASLEDKSFAQKRIEFCSEYIKRSEDKHGVNIGNMKISIAESYINLGKQKEGDALFEKYLMEDPKWGWGWIGWSDCYWISYGSKQNDFEKAETILKKALTVPELHDREHVMERLVNLYNDVDRKDEAAAIKREYSIQSSSRVKVGRNDPCPCGSGKKYKKCCGK